MFQWYWELDSNAQSPSLREVPLPFPFSNPLFENNEDSTEFNQLETPVKSKPCYSPECPSAPKKKKLDNSHTFSPQVKTVDLSGL